MVRIMENFILPIMEISEAVSSVVKDTLVRNLSWPLKDSIQDRLTLEGQSDYSLGTRAIRYVEERAVPQVTNELLQIVTKLNPELDRKIKELAVKFSDDAVKNYPPTLVGEEIYAYLPTIKNPVSIDEKIADALPRSIERAMLRELPTKLVNYASDRLADLGKPVEGEIILKSQAMKHVRVLAYEFAGKLMKEYLEHAQTRNEPLLDYFSRGFLYDEANRNPKNIIPPESFPPKDKKVSPEQSAIEAQIRDELHAITRKEFAEAGITGKPALNVRAQVQRAEHRFATQIAKIAPQNEQTPQNAELKTKFREHIMNKVIQPNLNGTAAKTPPKVLN